tara:strand:+ start:6 stop:134 length:129 start_codon:yes stop_codon:yes gene_type:complete
MWLEVTWVEAMGGRAMVIRAMEGLWWQVQGAMGWGVASEIET